MQSVEHGYMHDAHRARRSRTSRTFVLAENLSAAPTVDAELTPTTARAVVVRRCGTAVRCVRKLKSKVRLRAAQYIMFVSSSRENRL